MAKYVGLLCLLVGMSMPSSAVWAQQPISWAPTLEQAQHLASQTNRLVLIHFWAPWCGACKRMESDVLAQPSVLARLNADYVPVKIDADHFPATARKYGITALPTTVILSPQGHMLDSIRGRLEADQYTMHLVRAVSTVRQREAAVYAQASAAPAGIPSRNTQPVSNAPSVGGRYAASYPQSQLAPAASPSQPYAAPSQFTGPYPASPQPPANAMNSTVPSATVPAIPSPAPVVASPIYASQSPPPNGQPINTPVNEQPMGPALSVQPSTSFPANPPTAQTTPPENMVATPVLPSGSPPLGLEGFCPVSLCEKQAWVPGDRRWGAIHRGRTYLFASPEEQRRFFTDPDRYAPAIAGNDVVLAVEQKQNVPGMRRHGVYCGNRVYLFASEDTLAKFARNPTLYTNQALEAIRPGSPPAPQIR